MLKASPCRREGPIEGLRVLTKVRAKESLKVSVENEGDSNFFVYSSHVLIGEALVGNILYARNGIRMSMAAGVVYSATICGLN